MIKVYTDTSFITPQYRRIIFPLLFDLCYINNLVLLEKYTLVDSIEEAEVVIVPVDVGYFFKNNKRQWLYSFIDEAIRMSKKVWVYSAGDFGITLNAAVYTFRLGGFSSKLNSKTFVLPSFIMDPYHQLHKEFKPIPKRILPKIGFVGHANGSFSKWVKEYLIYLNYNTKRIAKQEYIDYQPFYPSSSKRFNFLSALEKNKNIETHFIYRDKYRAGVKTEKEKNSTTLDFFENIYNMPYTFCLRGAGNFSVRFYETLAMGRIPFVIDTDISLPLLNNIPWEKHCVMTTEKNFMDTLIHFHKQISETDFEYMQINNRKLWLNYLNRDAYFNTIHAIFKEL
jgi:hypothetical protein